MAHTLLLALDLAAWLCSEAFFRSTVSLEFHNFCLSERADPEDLFKPFSGLNLRHCYTPSRDSEASLELFPEDKFTSSQTQYSSRKRKLIKNR